MSKIFFHSEETKKKAYELVNNPTILFRLLYLKYGDIEDEIYNSYANQVIFNEYSHFNIIYKEHLYNYPYEFFQFYSNISGVREQLSKLTSCYKNYSIFFSKPEYTNFYYNKIISKYYEKKAEYFYNNNYSKNKAKKNDSNQKNKSLSDNNEISSFDNDTNNDIIFDTKIKKIIDNNLDSRNVTITLNINSKKDLNYINKSNISNSFAKIVENLVNYEKYKNLRKKNNNEGRNNKYPKKFITQLLTSKMKNEEKLINKFFRNDCTRREEGNKTSKTKIKNNKIDINKNSMMTNKKNNDNSSKKIKLINIICKNKNNKISLNKQKDVYPFLNRKFQEKKEPRPIMKMPYPQKKNTKFISLNAIWTTKMNGKNNNFYSPINKNTNRILSPKYKKKIILNSSDVFDMIGFNSLNYDNSNDFKTLRIHYKSSFKDKKPKLNLMNKKKSIVTSPRCKHSHSTENIKYNDYFHLKDLIKNYKLNSKKKTFGNRITKFITIENELLKNNTQRRKPKHFVYGTKTSRYNININEKKYFFPISFKKCFSNINIFKEK